MRKYFLLLILFIILLTTCTEKEPTTPEEIPQEVLAEATIGPEGGTLETKDFILTLASVAFSSVSDMKLYNETDNKPNNESTVLELYRNDELPVNFQKPLRMAIKYKGSLSKSVLLILL